MNAAVRTPLSELQQNVVNAILRGTTSINVVARAGCGKTYLCVNGVIAAVYAAKPRDEIVIMAYNKAAADEIKARLAKIGIDDWRRVQAGTCHSFGFQAFRKLAPKVKVDDRKVANLIAELAGTCGIDATDPLNPYVRYASTIKRAVSLAKQSAFGFLVSTTDRTAWFDLIDHFGLDDDLPETDRPELMLDEIVDLAINVLRASIKRDFDVIDFDDMILAPLIHKARFWGKDLVILDEAQDTNPARRALALAMMKAKYGKLMAVGDDRQAIYGFTGADSDAMDILVRELGSKTLPLNVTYRCPKAVVALAQRLVPDLTAHPSAPEGIVREIPEATRRMENGVEMEAPWYVGENLHGPKFAPNPETGELECVDRGDAILCRNTKPLIETAYRLIRDGIGCMVEGRDIGRGLVALATKWSRVKTLQALSAKLEEYREREVTKWLAKGREEKADAIEDKVGTLQVIVEKLTANGQTSINDLRTFIDGLFGDSADATPKTVVLCSGHRSKGREWTRVYHLGRARFLPSRYARKDWQLRQEENLEYVMITRAMAEYVDVVVEG